LIEVFSVDVSAKIEAGFFGGCPSRRNTMKAEPIAGSSSSMWQELSGWRVTAFGEHISPETGCQISGLPSASRNRQSSDLVSFAPLQTK